MLGGKIREIASGLRKRKHYSGTQLAREKFVFVPWRKPGGVLMQPATKFYGGNEENRCAQPIRVTYASNVIMVVGSLGGWLA